MYTLVMGNKNYSSWSVRPWLLMRHFGIPFEERCIGLFTPGYQDEIRRYSPSGRVPSLIDGEDTVWDSLAICEYLAERHPGLWPDAPLARAVARSVSAEMHAGFQALRSAFVMNIRRRSARRVPEPEVVADIDRIAAIWQGCRLRFGEKTDEPFLFGRFCIADAMYAPICFRFQTYGVTLEGAAGAYMHAMLDSPALQALAREAAEESAVIEAYDDL